MARRHAPPESTHPNRWMVSYADLMTLLFALFVVMYATTSIHSEKFEKMSEVFVGVFDQPRKAAIPSNIESLITDLKMSFQDDQSTRSSFQAHELIQQLSQMIEKTLPNVVPEFYNWDEAVQVTLPSDVMFTDDAQQISVQGESFLVNLANTLQDTELFLYIEVFNDSDVNETNPWQLGSTQMMAAMQLLMLEQVSPTKIAGVAYGPFQPVATNDDEEGKSLNRRLNFVIYHNLQHFNRLKMLANKQKSAKDYK